MRYQDQAKDNKIKVVKDELHRILNLPEQVLNGSPNNVELKNLSDTDKKKILSLIFEAEVRTNTVIQVLKDKGCVKTATYLKSSRDKMFGSLRQRLASRSFAPRASSHIEKMMDHIGIRLKKIGRNFSPTGAEKLAAIILKRKCSAKEWDQDWSSKMGLRYLDQGLIPDSRSSQTGVSIIRNFISKNLGKPKLRRQCRNLIPELL